VCLSVGHVREPCGNGRADQNAVCICFGDSSGPEEPCVRWGPQSAKGRAIFGRRGSGGPLQNIGTLCGEMSFWLKTQVGPRNHVLEGGQDPTTGRGTFEGRGSHMEAVCYAITAECLHSCNIPMESFCPLQYAGVVRWKIDFCIYEKSAI